MCTSNPSGTDQTTHPRNLFATLVRHSDWTAVVLDTMCGFFNAPVIKENASDLWLEKVAKVVRRRAQPVAQDDIACSPDFDVMVPCSLVDAKVRA